MTRGRLALAVLAVLATLAGLLVVSDDSRVVAFAVWGLGAVGVFGVNLAREIRAYHWHHDARASRDLLVAAGLFITALGAAASVWLVLFGQPGTDIRRFVVSVALGSFFGVGVVMATAQRMPDPADPSP